MTTNNLASRFFVAFLFLALFASCDEDTEVTTGNDGRLTVEITDAPIDDPAVSAVFVTVADVKVDGQSLSGFQRTTVELSALQNGVTETLINTDVAAASYSTLEIVLDDAADAATDGGPGCYLLTEDNAKLALEVAGDGALTAQSTGFEVVQGATTALVIDFDLRKALVRTQDETEPYAFAAENRLESSLRLVSKAETGTLTGTVNNTSGQSGEIVIYAYENGTYSESEATADTDDGQYLNAVASARVNSSGDYQISFLPAGSYELIAVNYADEDNDGELEVKGQFSITTMTGLDLGGIAVTANSETSLSFILTGLLP
ncbi:DUF4382 domain-containing protein [Lewinella sp. W8]|uniref:DUF4382 domain-containing protein n=1 Tax=Lewinella sp. W8 TaxID=2528208 RepID=UPI0010678136|nr:DUF4382 domain-containing protein [Lewinella sp. W8]MTB49965.1 DUF4382 domain-containing protein [Lewinella sp. W8]